MRPLAVATVAATGQRLYYDTKEAWNVRYYSFDAGDTWHRSKEAAYRHARDAGTLHPVGTVRVTTVRGTP